MTTDLSIFWKNFQAKDFKAAQKQFEILKDEQKQSILTELFQKSQYAQMPIMVSVLRRKLHENQTFDDFYNAWLPTQDMSNKIETAGQVFQQHFPTPVRVFNALNINDPSEVFSIGITWVKNKEDEAGLWEYIKKASAGEDKNNEARHEKIKKVADGELLGVCQIKSDDNLGTPF